MKTYRVQPKKCRLVNDGAAIRLPAERIAGPEAAEAVARKYLAGLPHEEIVAIALDAGGGILAVLPVSRGGINGAAVLPGDILRPVLVSGARCFVLAHNHPSGEAEPSADDVSMTRALVDACRAVQVQLLDHLVIGRETVSFAERGML